MQSILTSEIAGYLVIVVGDTVRVLKNDRLITRQMVEGLEEFIQQIKDLRTSWTAFPDFEVIYLYDRNDENFGYAVNLADSHLSEWGYTPFEQDETITYR